MIAFLSGTLEYLSGDLAVIDVGGVGYEVNVSAEVSGNLSSIGTGNIVKLYTYMYVREGQIALYGFLSRGDLALFKLLITVSGVGPKGGLSLLSVLSADDLRFAIVTGDAKMISRAPGIGKKTAERLILDLYDEDFGKIDPTGKAARIFAAIPAQLNSNASRYQISNVIPGAHAEDFVELISEMEKTRTVNISHHSDDPNVGLGSTEDLMQYKMFVGDTGLFVTLAFRDKAFTENIIYERLLSDKLATNLGYLYENIVAQMLTATGNKLFYHVWPTESGKHNYEIDFLLSRGTKIMPIEVKSSSYKTHVSLDAFCKKYSSRITNDRYLIYTKDYAHEESVRYIPAYLAYFL